MSELLCEAAVQAAAIPAHRQRLFIPGPTDVAAEVLAAQTAPMIGHRSDEFEALFARCEAQLRQLFFTKTRVFTVVASGTGLQEAAVRNLVEQRMLSFVNGAFSQRWHDVAASCGKQVVRADIPWNSAVKPEQVADALQDALATGPVEAIAVVHNETSTGVMSPVREIADAVRAISPETLVLVDAVSSFGGARLATDDWGLDVVLTSSQKALALPPGLAFCAVSDRALQRARAVSGRGWYFDFLRLEKSRQQQTTPATPAISLMRSLAVQLDRILDEGIEQRFARHARLADRTQRWALANGFELMAEAGYRSHTVTTVTNTRAISVNALNAALARQEMEISNGYGDYKDKAFRIAHMGEVQESDLERLFAAIEHFLTGQQQ